MHAVGLLEMVLQVDEGSVSMHARLFTTTDVLGGFQAHHMCRCIDSCVCACTGYVVVSLCVCSVRKHESGLMHGTRTRRRALQRHTHTHTHIYIQQQQHAACSLHSNCDAVSLLRCSSSLSPLIIPVLPCHTNLLLLMFAPPPYASPRTRTRARSTSSSSHLSAPSSSSSRLSPDGTNALTASMQTMSTAAMAACRACVHSDRGICPQHKLIQLSLKGIEERGTTKGQEHMRCG